MPAAVFFTILDRVDSTNNYAMQQVHAGLATHGMAWLALEQTAGKGQRGKSWDAEPGKNIALSMVLQPGKSITSQPFYLSAGVALACYEFFSRYAGDETKIKWPNDLYWRDRKAGGVLIETIYHGREWKWAIVGIGININQVNFDAGLKNPVSLKQITGKEHDVVVLAKELQMLVLEHINKLSKIDRGELLKAYNHHLYKRNEVVRLRKDNMNFETMIKEVSPQGKLVTIDAFERYFDFDEVEWIL
jgi:BirA family biotin operon repressor/biotin-[acetyl-CoA-carboxylase] ligase